MCLLVLAPTAQVVRYVTIQRDVIGSLFSTGRHVAPSAAGLNQAHPNSGMADPWAGTPRVNVLLLGSDAGADRTGVRTDSMMVASINTRTGDTVLFGVPRNLQNVPFPEHDPLHKLYPNGLQLRAECLMNAVWTLAEEHRDLFPGDNNPGLTATRDVVGDGARAEDRLLRRSSTSTASGRWSTRWAASTSTSGSASRSAATSAPAARSAASPAGSTPGPQHLNGYQALWFSRSRATTDDFSRMRRQRCMVGALVDQVNPVTHAGEVPRPGRGRQEQHPVRHRPGRAARVRRAGAADAEGRRSRAWR